MSLFADTYEKMGSHTQAHLRHSLLTDNNSSMQIFLSECLRTLDREQSMLVTPEDDLPESYARIGARYVRIARKQELLREFIIFLNRLKQEK